MECRLRVRRFFPGRTVGGARAKTEAGKLWVEEIPVSKPAFHVSPRGISMPPKSSTPPLKAGLHPRNRHRAGYDFDRLTRSAPELAPFVAINPYGNASINFADPAAVKALNQALLKSDYGVATWDVPPGYLCPPIPGRADYLHHLADLLGGAVEAKIPRGAEVAILDIGVGANCIYPIIGYPG